MKKTILILLSVLMLFSSFSLGEEIHGVIYDPEQNVSLAEIRIRQDEEQILICTSLLPEWIFQVKTEGALVLSVPDLSPQCFLNLTSAFLRWTALLSFKEVKGLFSSDLVNSAAVKKTADLSWGDLITLFDLVEYNTDPLPDGTNSLLAALKGQLIETAEKYPDIRFKTDLFEAEKAIAVSAVQGENTVATFSMRLESDNHLHIVIGSAENGRTYYREIKAELSGMQELTMNLRAYADDLGAGYGTMEISNLLFDENIRIGGLGTSLINLRAEYSFGPEKMSGGSISAEILRNENGCYTLNAGIYAENNPDTELIRIRVDTETSEQSEWPAEAKYYDLGNPDASLTEELQQEINEKAGEWLNLLLKLISRRSSIG